jgi:hypothetical protein
MQRATSSWLSGFRLRAGEWYDATMRLRPLHGSRDRETDSLNPTLELPASALELARPAPEALRAAAQGAPWTPGARAGGGDVAPTSPARTARAQYLESEEYEPLSAFLVGRLDRLPGRLLLIVAILIAYNAALGSIAVQAWHAAETSDDRLLVLAVIGIGAVIGWAAADIERTFRSRSRLSG